MLDMLVCSYSSVTQQRSVSPDADLSLLCGNPGANKKIHLAIKFDYVVQHLAIKFHCVVMTFRGFQPDGTEPI